MLSAYVRFQKEPFASSPDPEFIYNHTAFESIGADLIFFELSEGKGLFLIVGAPGTGKSILLSNILRQSKARDCCAYVVCREDHSFAALLRTWCDQLGIDPETSDPEARLQALRDHLSRRAQGGATPALFLDDAEKLPDETLARLCEIRGIDTGTGRPLQIVLAARPEIDARLRQSNLQSVKQQITCRRTLDPLSHEEVGHYIGHRLRVAGNQGPEPFSAEAIEGIAKASGGVPAAIDALCDTALRLAELQGQGTVSMAIVEQAIRGCAGTAREDEAARLSTVSEGPPLKDEYSRRSDMASLEAATGRPETATIVEFDAPPRGDLSPGTGSIEEIRAVRDSATAVKAIRDRQWPTPLNVNADEMAAAWSGRNPGAQVEARRARHGRLWLMVGVIAVGLLFGGGAALYQFQFDQVAAIWLAWAKAPEQPGAFTGLPEAAQEGTRAPEPPRLEVANASGREDEPIPIDIKAALGDGDGSESLSIVLSGLPKGARLSTGKTDSTGTWRLTAKQLPDLRLLPPPRFSGEFLLTAGATALEKDGNSATTTRSLNVTVAAAPLLDSGAAPEIPSVDPPAATEAADDQTAAASATELAARSPADPKLGKWMARGDKLLAFGDLAAARLFYQLALDHGSAAAATAIGKSYDPLHLRKLGIESAPADRDMAMTWYRRAIDAGDEAAVTRLKSLTLEQN